MVVVVWLYVRRASAIRNLHDQPAVIAWGSCVMGETAYWSVRYR